MKLVLTENIRGLGRTGDVVTVKNGHGRNHLLPKGFGVVPSENNISRYRTARETYLVAEQDRIVDAQKLAEKLGDVTLSLTMKANDAGHLFGSVTETMIAEGILKVANVEVASSMVVMGAHLKQVGEHAVQLHLHSEVELDLLVTVIAEEGTTDVDADEEDGGLEQATGDAEKGAEEQEVSDDNAAEESSADESSEPTPEQA